MLIKLVLLWTAGMIFVSSDDEFGYEAGDPDPDHWATKYKTCSGKYQSPIEIEENLVTIVHLPFLEFWNFYLLPKSMTIKNNGHTVVVQSDLFSPVLISGGPLNSIYELNQFHFHWGVNDSVGSEDLLNNHSYSMELHMVFTNTKYDGDEYKTKCDGLVVLASFFVATEFDNLAFTEIVNSLEKIHIPGQSECLNPVFSIGSLLPEFTECYITYKGSLTTPPCSEIVTWIDFTRPIRISHRQIQAFRLLRSKHGNLTHNDRPVQPLSGRPVSFNMGDMIICQQCIYPQINTPMN